MQIFVHTYIYIYIYIVILQEERQRRVLRSSRRDEERTTRKANLEEEDAC